jgi:predicted transcriptional regulator
VVIEKACPPEGGGVALAEGMLTKAECSIAATKEIDKEGNGHPEEDAKKANPPTSSMSKIIKIEAVNTPKESKIIDLKRKLLEVKAKARDQKVAKGGVGFYVKGTHT